VPNDDDRVAEVVSITRPGTSPTSTIVYRVGGREYPMRMATHCRVCNSRHRAQIEEALLKGYGYAPVARNYGEEEGLTTQNVAEHVRNQHLPMDLAVRRGIMEEHARQVGKSIEEAETSIIDYLGFARIGLQRVLERVATGEIQPDIKDGIEFAKLIMKAEELAGDGGNLDHQVVLRGFLSYMQAVAKVCTPAQVKEIGALISSNPVVKGYLQKASAIDVDEEAAHG
jgi:hypothetical protein